LVFIAYFSYFIRFVVCLFVSQCKVACKPKVVRMSSENGSSGGIAIDADNSLPKGYIVAEENEWYFLVDPAVCAQFYPLAHR
jgi:hypothetical protein